MSTNTEQIAQGRQLLTGEQMDPACAGASCFWEHVHRYRFAARWVRGKAVLDIACGEGYGAASLRESGAASVVGVDIAESVCEHARRRYGLQCIVGNAEAIPLPAQSCDIVVSFETIEHVPNPALFLDETRRVLRPGGILILSSPNRPVYAETGPPNPFHCSEMTEEDFTKLLSEKYQSFESYSQTPRRAAWWSLRSFCAQEPWWIHFKGAYRLRNFCRGIFSPYLSGHLDPCYRDDPVSAVLMKTKWWGSFFNPFAIRRRNKWCPEEPTYIIAVARV